MSLYLSVLNIAYRLIVVYILLIIVWNILTLKDFKLQVMSAIVMIPLLLRAINII